ncbi:tubulin folding cofactor D C terminal-domain-containing protein [Pyronema domesticum]|uniref:Similar to Tubulin-specific chaperone D acc. no. Q28205 n=1 Tax=Pyronema omphalodes (strain CBS 100304) TaxID=1076935 RepID=U4LD35_PYROM|nr:tubulin folding cofactor D C terminal-domain-containing protein [Pyronema domesticum]CCX08404.1 Similar to Tubulin-specific chaperone D; acc. no. Q28205 [Pyronema omphalodes CBS 100304]
MDAAGEDRDVKLLQISGGLFDIYFNGVPEALYAEDGALRQACERKKIESLINMLEPFQESPQLLDPQLPRFLSPLTAAFTTYLSNIPPPGSDSPPAGHYTLPVALSRILYTLVKIRGAKIISRFLPNQPSLLEDVSALFTLKVTGVDESWELRYILLLWLSHLLLAPFDLSTISTDPPAGVIVNFPAMSETGLNVEGLPHLSKRILDLGISYLSSPGNRESDAAALLLIRISLRRDMRSLGLLDAMVEWGIKVVSKTEAEGTVEARALFLKTGVLAVLAGFLAQGDSDAVEGYVPRIFELVTRLQDQECEEWKSAGVRRLGMKILRWVATLVLAQGTEAEYIEDIIERLLNSLGDRDTAVRFGASKSLAVVARKLDPDMAGDVLEAVMGVYEEDVFYDPPIAYAGFPQKKMLTAVTPEKWHGATLTLATFLRQRAVRSTDVMTRVVECIVEALSFEQRRSTFAVGGNVRDAACYAAWSLARSYTTSELQEAGDIVVPATQFEGGRKIIQLLATELVVAGCTDPLGNVRRAASAALQELVGRHSGCVREGIPLVQVVDYNAVALRQRSVVTVASLASKLDEEYWKGVVLGLADGWRGIGSGDDDGRKLAATSLGQLVRISYPTDTDTSIRDRGRFVFSVISKRVRMEGLQHLEIYHGCLHALADVLDGLPDGCLDDEDKLALHDVFSHLKGFEFTNPVMRPELTAECTCRLVRSLAFHTPSLLSSLPLSWKRWTAIIEASLDRSEDSVLDQAIPAARMLLEKATPSNRADLISYWSNKISDLTYRRRGHILALGEVLAGISDSTIDLNSVTAILLSAAKITGDVEIRVAAVKALGKHVSPTKEVLQTILESLDDYAVDTRGDIGSWVRAEAIIALLSLWEHVPEDMRWSFIAKLVRLAVEKLDRLRIRAGEALLVISASFPAISLPTDLALLSPQEYFAAILSLLEIPQCREQLLEGYVTSAGAGSDSVMKASRRALIGYLSTSSSIPDISNSLMAVFKSSLAAQNSDRIVIPLLDVISLLLDLGLLPGVGRKVFVETQKAHFKTTSVQKLTAAIRVYRSLALAEEGVKGDAIGKLVGMLLHPFPRVRMDVSEALFSIAIEQDRGRVSEEMGKIDWGKGTKELREAVGRVKKGLC